MLLTSSRQSCIRWTVEWINPDLTRDLVPSNENEPINTAYENIATSRKAKRDKRHFYLHKSLANHKSKVLIPLRAESTFSNCLRGRDILEFPTIYVLEHGPNELPDGFITAQAYMQQHKKLLQEVDEQLGSDASVDVNQAQVYTGGHQLSATEPEQNQVLESLQRDLDVVRQYAS